ncbi:MAG: hypothetical protein ACRDDY_03990 [Clostridium sp.]|uniref:hypothetical protein n=1 Tax=Clostridium sp. TaxID=1506 RepID=UPI003EE7A936
MATERKPEGYHVLTRESKESLIFMVLDLKKQILDLEKEKQVALIEVTKANRLLETKNSELAVKGQDDMVRKVLEYRARKLTPTQIQYKLEMQGYDATVELIERLLDSEWTLEMEAFFKKCEEEYLETVNINPALFRITNLTKLQAMNDAYEKMLREDAIDDAPTKLKIMKDMQENIKKMEEIVRNVQDERLQSGEDQEDMATTEANNWEETVGSFMSFEGHEDDIIDIEEV